MATELFLPLITRNDTGAVGYTLCKKTLIDKYANIYDDKLMTEIPPQYKLDVQVFL